MWTIINRLHSISIHSTILIHTPIPLLFPFACAFQASSLVLSCGVCVCSEGTTYLIRRLHCPFTHTNSIASIQCMVHSEQWSDLSLSLQLKAVSYRVVYQLPYLVHYTTHDECISIHPGFFSSVRLSLYETHQLSNTLTSFFFFFYSISFLLSIRGIGVNFNVEYLLFHLFNCFIISKCRCYSQ